MSETKRTAQDVRENPKPGDVVNPIFPDYLPPVPPEHSVVVCQAVIGNLIAITVGGSSKIEWKLREYWCETTTSLRGWEVLHVAE